MTKTIKKTKAAPKVKSLLQLLEEKVDVNKLLRSVYLDEDKLGEAALEQPALTFSAGRFRVQRMHKRIALETRLDLAKSQAAQRFRRIRDGGGKKEFTNPEVAERVELDPMVRKLRKQVDVAIALEELSKNMLEVFRTRSDSLRIIVNAGKVTVHLRELEILQQNKKLRRAVIGLRNNWLRAIEEQ